MNATLSSRVVYIPLSKLVPSKRNPRRVKPDRDAHRRKVASIRSLGLIQPLVVRPDVNGNPGCYRVIAGNGRLAALKEIYRHAKKSPKIACVLRRVDDGIADALALAENVVREKMHPLDEAEEFARLAGDEGKDAKAIAVQFGETEHYIRQRMKLATLADPIKMAYRGGAIDTGTAEVFTSVPEDRQLVVWQEVHGQPRHAEHVRNIINAAWIDAAPALFDLSTLPESVISKDLFGERVLVERSAFMEAQTAALAKERDTLMEDGWREVVVGSQAELQDRLWSMTAAEVELDEATTKKLKAIEERWEKLEAKVANIPEDDDGTKAAELQGQLDAVEAEAGRVRAEAPERYGEATKAKGTAFLMLDAEGKVRREYRVLRPQPNGRHSEGSTDGATAAAEALPTSDELSDRQLATTFTHHALAVREAVFKNRLARKRVLVMILHDRVRSEALAIKHDANGTTVHADNAEGFKSDALASLRKRRTEVDPFAGEQYVEDVKAYKRLCKLSERQLDALVELLTVEALTAHFVRPTKLIHVLAAELKVNLRDGWRPDADWLKSYQKPQLSHLTAELCGEVHRPAPEKKKSEVVASLEKLFADAAVGTLEDKKLSERVNRWLPANFWPEPGSRK